jgi:hypothetical protein
VLTIDPEVTGQRVLKASEELLMAISADMLGPQILMLGQGPNLPIKVLVQTCIV